MKQNTWSLAAAPFYSMRDGDEYYFSITHSKKQHREQVYIVLSGYRFTGVESMLLSLATFPAKT